MAAYWNKIAPIWDVISIDTPESFQASFSKVRPELGFLYAAHFCQSEICNGGFTQFFWNSTGVLAPEAALGFTAMGQPEVAKRVQQAMTMLQPPYPRERTARQAALWALIPHTAFETQGYRNIESFQPLEKDFYALLSTENGGFEVAADIYAASIGG